MNGFWSLLLTGSTRPSASSDVSERAHRVAASDTPPSLAASPDYADAFEISRSPTDQRSAEQWARDGFEHLPLPTRQSLLFVHRRILGFSLGPWASPNHVLGWRIVTSDHDLLHLEAHSRLLNGHMLWRLHERRLVMTTSLYFEMRRTAPLVWAVIGNIHRGGAPHFFELARTARP
jgi:hypothetical protein